MRRTLAPILLGMLMSTGCSSLKGGEVPKRDDQSEKVVGVPYYLTKPTFRVEQKTLHGGQKAQVVNEIVVTAEPDPASRFQVGLDPGLFSSDNFSLTISPDGRVTALSAKSTDETGRVVAETAKFAAAIAKLVALSATNVKAVFTDAETNGLISNAEATTATAAIDALMAVIDASPPPQLPPPLPKSDLRNWKKSYEKLRKILIQGTETRTGPFKGLGELIENRDNIAPSIMPPKEPSLVANVQSAEKAILDVYEDLEMLDAFQSEVAKYKPGTVATVFAGLRKEYRAALAAAVHDPANKPAAINAAANIKDAIAIVLEADDELGKRGLGKRRDVLVRFLKTKIQPTSGGAAWKSYAQFSAALDSVYAAIAAAIGETPSSESKTLPLGTQVTTRIDDVFVDRHSMPLGPSDRKMRLKLAGARIKTGGVGAVIIVSPQKGGSL